MTASSAESPRRREAPPAAAVDVVELRPGGPPARPRGGSASEEVVELYKLLYTADGPLGFEEIADQLPSAFRSHAYRQYRDAQTADGVPIKDDKWSDREKRTAWLWWVGELITTSRAQKRIIGTARDGSRPTGKRRDQLVYTANRNKPPLVVQRVTEDRLVHWTPTIGDTGKRHAAGMSFLQQVRPALDAPKLDATVARKLLELAEKAIRAEPVD